MSAIIRPVLSRTALAFAVLSSLILLLALACASESTPVESTPPVPTATPVGEGIVQTSGEAAIQTAPRSFKAAPEATGEIQASVSESEDDISGPAPRSGENLATSNSQGTGTGGASQAAYVPRIGGNGGDDKAPLVLRTGGTSGDNQAAAIPEKGELKYPNLGSRLDELVTSVEAGEATAEQAARAAVMHNQGSVAVTIYLSGGVDGVVAFLEENGGDPRNVGDDYIEAYVPVNLLGPASERPGVLRVREIVPPAPGRAG